MKNIFSAILLLLTFSALALGVNEAPFNGACPPANLLYVNRLAAPNNGLKGRSDYPFQTLTAAKNAATNGDTIVVMPGTYAENNLLKNGVNWWFAPGAVVSNAVGGLSANDNTTLVYGIFDDRAGPVTNCIIGGRGTFVATSQGYLQLKGTVVLTNANSSLSLQCKEIGFSLWSDLSAGIGTRAALFVANCARCDVTCDRIYDPGVATVYQPGILDWVEYGSGVYWNLGPLYLTVNTIDQVGSYSIWGDQPNGNTTAADMYVRADQIVSHIYMDGANGVYTWKTWIFVNQLLEFPSYFDGGRHYLTCQKIQCVGSTIGFNGATQVWLTAQKITNAGGGGWMTLGAGNGGSPRLFADVLEFDDTQGSFTTAGITINDNSVLWLRAGQIKTLNSNPEIAILHNGGNVRIVGATIDTSAANNAGNNPVKVAAAGLILQDCTLVAPALADSVTAGSAQTITAYACKVNKAKNANVTVNVDALTLDANVK